MEAAGHRTMMQAWDFVPGTNFIDFMDRGLSEAKAVVAVLSRNYLRSRYGRLEWMAALRAAPDDPARKLVTVRIEDCPIDGLLSTITYVDLVGVDDPDEARGLLMRRIREALAGHARPLDGPGFPGGGSAAPGRAEPLPGRLEPSEGAEEPSGPGRQDPSGERPARRAPVAAPAFPAARRRGRAARAAERPARVGAPVRPHPRRARRADHGRGAAGPDLERRDAAGRRRRAAPRPARRDRQHHPLGQPQGVRRGAVVPDEPARPARPGGAARRRRAGDPRRHPRGLPGVLLQLRGRRHRAAAAVLAEVAALREPVQGVLPGHRRAHLRQRPAVDAVPRPRPEGGRGRAQLDPAADAPREGPVRARRPGAGRLVQRAAPAFRGRGLAAPGSDRAHPRPRRARRAARPRDGGVAPRRPRRPVLPGHGVGVRRDPLLGGGVPAVPALGPGRHQTIVLHRDGLERWIPEAAARRGPERLERAWPNVDGTFPPSRTEVPPAPPAPELGPGAEDGADPVPDPAARLLDRLTEACETRFERATIRRVVPPAGPDGGRTRRTCSSPTWRTGSSASTASAPTWGG
ncbi:toll/interleukin-1 receptor domain-containing protein [Actinomadura madurae]|nr:toll/interleukin-1 receptor domain-containing protein [Actinomadura madurae]